MEEKDKEHACACVYIYVYKTERFTVQQKLIIQHCKSTVIQSIKKNESRNSKKQTKKGTEI